MKTRRRFSNVFKRIVIVSIYLALAYKPSSPGNIIFHNILSIRWRKDYSADKLAHDNNTDVLAREARIRELEQMLGQLAMENELLKNPRLSGSQRTYRLLLGNRLPS